MTKPRLNNEAKQLAKAGAKRAAKETKSLKRLEVKQAAKEARELVAAQAERKHRRPYRIAKKK
jgi:hypothetical protein